MKRIVLLSLILLLINSCILQSHYGLPEKEKIDNALLGEWKMENIEDGVIHFIKKSKTRYTVQFSDSSKLFDAMEAYVVRFGNHKILNLVTVTDNETFNAFVEYKVTDNTFKYHEVSDVDVEEFQSEKALYDYFENTIDDKNFLSEEEVVFIK